MRLPPAIQALVRWSNWSLVPRWFGLASGLILILLLPIAGGTRSLLAWQESGSGAGSQTPSTSAPLGDVHALARLEPASGVIVVGGRPGARIDRIQVRAGDNVKPGQVLAILEGNDQAQAQLALAEAQKTRAVHQRAVQKKKLILEREQFDKLNKARLESFTKVFAARQRFDQITKQYTELQKTLQGKDRFDLEVKYFETETQSSER